MSAGTGLIRTGIVERIEYVYEWWGLADPVFDYQSLESRDGSYWKGTEPVEPEAVDALLMATANLHPCQFLLAGNSHTDDYPSWTVELTGVDDQRILLFSSSTGNPGSGPWNILHNGRLYAQYDGSLGEPLASLFPGPTGSPAAAFFPGGWEPGSVAFATQGWPSQLTDGFVGLLPLASGFRYWADVETGEIQGYIEGRSSISGYGHMVIGTVTDLERVELVTDDVSALPCTVEGVLSEQDPVSAAWTFSCSVGNVVEGARYRYPVHVKLGTDAGEHLEVDGELQGVWRASPVILLMPVAEEIQEAMAEHEPALDLLTDHVPVGVNYVAQIQSQDPLSGTLAGEIILLGQTAIDQKPVRYSVGFPFSMKDGSLTRWDLSRDALQDMLQDILPLALTDRVLETAPTVVLNMWYAETGNMPELPPLINADLSDYKVRIMACETVPGGVFPTPSAPLRAFGFNAGLSFWQTDFVLVDGWPIVADLDLWPNQDDRGGVLPTLIPSQLDTGEHRPFERIWVQSAPFFGDQPTLTLWIPEDADAASLEVYRTIANSLPVPLERTYGTLWTAEGMTFVVTEEGDLDIVACGPPPPPTPTPSPSPTPTPPTVSIPFAPVPDGAVILFTSLRDGNDEIYAMNADGSGQTRLTNAPSDEQYPVWSPDGSRIVFTSNRDQDHWLHPEIYIVNADGSGLIRLTYNEVGDWQPDWSPDGTLIAFYSYRHGKGEIYVMNADGSEQTRLTHDPDHHDTGPSWSPDGTRIVFTSERDGNGEIYVMDLDGSAQKNLTNHLDGDCCPAWSPDGTRIAFRSKRDGNWEIYVMAADGSRQIRLTDNPAYDGEPSWSADGQRILFVSNRDGDTEIYVMNADGSGQTRLTDSPDYDNQPCWRPQ